MAKEKTEKLEVITLRVTPAVRARLIDQAKERGRTLAEHLREELATIADGVERDDLEASDTLPLPGLEPVLRELEDLRNDEHARDALLFDRLDRLARAFATSFEALLKLAASDSTGRFTREEVRAFVDRVFVREAD